MGFSFKFWTGVVLLLINQPMGWTALVICNGMSVKEENLNYSLLGIGIYALTWGMLGLGFLLSGREGMKYSLVLFKKLKENLKVFFNKTTHMH